MELTRGQSWLVVGLSVAIMTAAVAGVAVRASGTEPVVYRYAFAEGDSRTYALTISMEMQPAGDFPSPGSFDSSSTSTITLEVVEVHDDGSAVIRITLSDMNVPGVGEIPGEIPTSRMTVTPDGRVAAIDGPMGGFSLGTPGLPGAQAAEGAAPSFFALLPEHEIAPGDTWTGSHEVPMPFGGEPITITFEGRHDGFEDTDFGRAARIEQTMELPLSMDLDMGAFYEGMMENAPEQLRGMMSPPPGLGEARMVLEGSMSVESRSFVLPDPADVVGMVTTTNMSYSMEIVGGPQFPGMGPGSMQIQGTMRMHLERVA